MSGIAKLISAVTVFSDSLNEYVLLPSDVTVYHVTVSMGGETKGSLHQSSIHEWEGEQIDNHLSNFIQTTFTTNQSFISCQLRKQR